MFYFSRLEWVVLAVLVALLLTGAAAFTYLRGVHVGRTGELAPAVLEEAPNSRRSQEVIVDVGGAGTRPGGYHLPPGSRVADALAQAGGPAPGADLSAMNQAGLLRDGDRVVVPRAGEASPKQAAAPTTSAGPISLNAATAAQLESLPGIGPVCARRIIEYREKLVKERGTGFRSVDELLNVPGIGPKRLAAVRDLVVP